MQKNLKIKQKCKKIKLLLTDVDGVLTDGGRYYSKEGEVLKKFHVRDGMGVNILLRNNIKTIILTKEKSMITKKWAKDMNISQVYGGFTKKEKALTQICKKYKVSLKEIAFIGDDINDLEVLEKAAFSAVPNDAVIQVKKIADYTCKASGGKGCFREITDLILLSKFSSKT
uniref:N-acylneuraminate cytidylyltransferase (NeuA, CMAS) n=1 Tax=uncultured marine thaumarchaeote KM3_35_D03 TaxID=1456132 RepID=A0A075GZF4_9ARCH|nr:N-acylneuraminate cytidylyltransferase (neuA, CMAS) [uncultured marine thaumarchaeote KM3_35_D03]